MYAVFKSEIFTVICSFVFVFFFIRTIISFLQLLGEPSPFHILCVIPNNLSLIFLVQYSQVLFFILLSPAAFFFFNFLICLSISSSVMFSSVSSSVYVLGSEIISLSLFPYSSAIKCCSHSSTVIRFDIHVFFFLFLLMYYFHAFVSVLIFLIFSSSAFCLFFFPFLQYF